MTAAYYWKLAFNKHDFMVILISWTQLRQNDRPLILLLEAHTILVRVAFSGTMNWSQNSRISCILPVISMPPSPSPVIKYNNLLMKYLSWSVWYKRNQNWRRESISHCKRGSKVLIEDQSKTRMTWHRFQPGGGKFNFLWKNLWLTTSRKF